jgi:hypothetical protein
MHKVGRFDCGRIHLVPRGSGESISIDVPPAFCFTFPTRSKRSGEVIVTMDVVMSGTDMAEDTDTYPKIVMKIRL